MEYEEGCMPSKFESDCACERYCHSNNEKDDENKNLLFAKHLVQDPKGKKHSMKGKEIKQIKQNLGKR